MNNISNSSTGLPMYICTLPIVSEHGRFSATVEITQSDQLDCRHCKEGVMTTKPAGK